GMTSHLVDQIQRAAKIGRVVERRLGDRFRHDDLRRELEHAFGLELGEYLGDADRIGEIASIELPPLHGLQVAAGEVVEHGDLVTVLRQHLAHVRADVAGAAGNEESHPGTQWRWRRYTA